MGFKLLPEVIWGPGSLKNIGAVLEQIQAKHVLILTDQGIMKAGIAPRVIDAAKTVCETCEIFDSIEPDPKDTTIAACVDKYRENLRMQL